MEDGDRLTFWGNVFAGAKLTPKQNVALLGESGFEHRFPVVGYSDDGNTVALVLPEPDVVKGALIANDIRRASPTLNVSVVRPTIANTNKLITTAISKVFELRLRGVELKDYIEENAKVGTESTKLIFSEDNPKFFDGDKLLKLAEGTLFEDLVRAAVYSREVTGVYFVENLAQLFREVMSYDLPRIFAEDQLNLQELLPKQEPAREIRWGICPLPLQDFSKAGWEALLNGHDSQAAEGFLKEIGFYQFFRPPIDRTTLALVEMGVKSAVEVSNIIEEIDTRGHLHDQTEIVSGVDGFDSLIEKLQAKGLTIGGSIEMELTTEGKKERLLVQFQPREALFFKMLQQVPLLKELVSIFRRS